MIAPVVVPLKDADGFLGAPSTCKEAGDVLRRVPGAALGVGRGPFDRLVGPVAGGDQRQAHPEQFPRILVPALGGEGAPVAGPATDAALGRSWGSAPPRCPDDRSAPAGSGIWRPFSTTNSSSSSTRRSGGGGVPADIEPLNGTRVLVVHPANGTCGMGVGRVFPHMAPALVLDRILEPHEVGSWLGRIAPAVQDDLMAKK